LKHSSIDSIAFCTYPLLYLLTCCPAQTDCTFWTFSPISWLHAWSLLCPVTPFLLIFPVLKDVTYFIFGQYSTFMLR
jgi:hypothetical protein